MSTCIFSAWWIRLSTNFYMSFEEIMPASKIFVVSKWPLVINKYSILLEIRRLFWNKQVALIHHSDDVQWRSLEPLSRSKCNNIFNVEWCCKLYGIDNIPFLHNIPIKWMNELTNSIKVINLAVFFNWASD